MQKRKLGRTIAFYYIYIKFENLMFVGIKRLFVSCLKFPNLWSNVSEMDNLVGPSLCICLWISEFWQLGDIGSSEWKRCIYELIVTLFSVQLLVLKYVQNKDVFMRYHKAHLTRRLILDISADSEIEENMVEWLRVSEFLKNIWFS